LVAARNLQEQVLGHRPYRRRLAHEATELQPQRSFLTQGAPG